MLNAKELEEIGKLISKVWPQKFNKEQVGILVDSLKDFSFDVSIEAIKKCAVEPGFIGIGEIAAKAKMIAQDKARDLVVKKEPQPGCDSCRSGYVFTVDHGRPGAYEFVFRCPCSASAIQSPIPVWSESFSAMGFRRRAW